VFFNCLIRVAEFADALQNSFLVARCLLRDLQHCRFDPVPVLDALHAVHSLGGHLDPPQSKPGYCVGQKNDIG
jgi:hypothetical protein